MDAVLEGAQKPATKFFGLQVLEDAVKAGYVIINSFGAFLLVHALPYFPLLVNLNCFTIHTSHDLLRIKSDVEADAPYVMKPCLLPSVKRVPCHSHYHVVYIHDHVVAQHTSHALYAAL